MVIAAFLISTVFGFLSGLGIGGGSLLIVYLTLISGQSQETARAMNLLFFIPSALIASLFRIHQGKLKIREILPGIAAGCIAAAVFSWLSAKIETVYLKKAFGILLIAAGIRELFYRPKKLR